MRNQAPVTTDIPLFILDDEKVADYARTQAARHTPMAVVAGRYGPVLPFLVGSDGYTVALVADVADPLQLADVLHRVERRLGPVSRTVRTAADLPHAS